MNITSLTQVSTTLTDVAQNSVSSAVAEERWGIPGLIVRAGVAQVALVACIALFGGRRLWTFTLRTETPSEPTALLSAPQPEAAS